MTRLHTHLWPRSRLGEGIATLARRGSMRLAREEPPVAPADGEEVADWIESASAWCGIEAVALKVAHPELDTLLRTRGPLVLEVPGGLLLSIGPSRGGLLVLGTDRRSHRFSRKEVVAAFAGESGSDASTEVDRLLRTVPLSAPARAREHMIADHLNDLVHEGIWSLRPIPGASVTEAVRDARIPLLVGAFASAFLLDYVLFILSWWLIGQAALRGEVDWGWLTAWGLLFLTMIPVRMAGTWYEGRVAVAAGGLLKRRLLAGAMTLDPDETRKDGVGSHLSRVLESEAVESLAMSGGLLSATAALQLAVVSVILALGSGGAAHALALGLVAAITVVVSWRYYRDRREWTSARFRITQDVLEQMVGHRTRLAQLAPEMRHEREDTDLVTYQERARRADGGYAVLAVVKRVWLLVGLAALAPGFLAGQATLGRLAIAVGGTLLGYRAFEGLAEGLSDLVDAAIAWERVAPLFRAATRIPDAGDPAVLGLSRRTDALEAARSQAARPYLEASELTYRFPTRTEPAVRSASFGVGIGDRVLLTSPSGGGKSTLLSLLNGLRRPDSGTLLVEGIDRRSLGDEAWTRRIATAPQFHENHIFTETFAFNVLMGRRWPPEGRDWTEAEALCGELGLGDLLDKMPGGMNQLVGDTGWQLSHGERSRVYLARALLQGSPLVLLDESFAALDPDNLRQALDCARKRALSLVVIAHP